MRRLSSCGHVFVILGLLAGSAQPVMAQARAVGFRPFTGAESKPPRYPLWSLPDSVRRPPPTQWRAGLLVGAALGGIVGGYLGHGLCKDSETSHGSCSGSLLSGALVLAVPAGRVGALIGGAFPASKSRPDSTQR